MILLPRLAALVVHRSRRPGNHHGPTSCSQTRQLRQVVSSYWPAELVVVEIHSQVATTTNPPSASTRMARWRLPWSAAAPTA